MTADVPVIGHPDTTTERDTFMNNAPRIIGFGGRKGAGKDAAAWTLEHLYGFHRESVSVAIDLAATSR